MVATDDAEKNERVGQSAIHSKIIVVAPQCDSVYEEVEVPSHHHHHHLNNEQNTHTNTYTEKLSDTGGN